MKRQATTKFGRGAVLVIVLWIVVLLSVILLNMGYTIRTETLITANYVNDHELRQIAYSGVDCGIAVLSQDTEPGDHYKEIWGEDEELFFDHAIGAGSFTLVRFEYNGEEIEQLPGMEDEAGKLNLRTADREKLKKLGGLTDEQISAILDWQDQDSNVQELGAEADYYASLRVPYPTKNAGLRTIDEMFLIRSMDGEAIYGEDWNQNGTLEAAEKDGKKNRPLDDENNILDPGILPYVTVYSTDRNVTAAGTTRVNINSASEEDLKKNIPGLTDEEAKAIVNHRQKEKFDSVGKLLNVEEVASEQEENKPQEAPENENSDQRDDRRRRNRQQDQQGDQSKQEENKPPENKEGESQQAESGAKTTGKKIITADRLKQIIDYCRIDDEETKAGRINVNTATARVLTTLPGIEMDMAEQIVRTRRENGKIFRNIADLLDVQGMTTETFIPISELITVKSDQFRIRSEARIEGVKVQKRIVTVVDRTTDGVKTLYWNEQ